MGVKGSADIKLINRSSNQSVQIQPVKIEDKKTKNQVKKEFVAFPVDITSEVSGSTKQINKLNKEYVHVNPIMLDAFNHMDADYFKSMGHGLPIDLQGFNAADVGLALKKIEKQVKKNSPNSPDRYRMIYTFGKYMIVFYDPDAFSRVATSFSNLGRSVPPGIELRSKDTSLFATVRFDLTNPRNPRVELSRNKSVFKNKVDGKMLQFLAWSLIQPDDKILEGFLNKLATKAK